MTNIVIILIVFAILGAFYKAAKNAKPLQNELGDHILAYSQVIKWFCMGVVIVGASGLTLALLLNPVIDASFTAIVCTYIALALFGLYFYIEFFTVKIILNEVGIKATSGWRGMREYTWNDIDKITYSLSSMWFKVESKGRASLRVHAFISGITAVPLTLIKEGLLAPNDL